MVQKNTRKKRHVQKQKKKHVWLLSGRCLHIEGRLNEGPQLQRKHEDENEAKRNKRNSRQSRSVKVFKIWHILELDYWNGLELE